VTGYDCWPLTIVSYSTLYIHKEEGRRRPKKAEEGRRRPKAEEGRRPKRSINL
jgi:hypothetical protein